MTDDSLDRPLSVPAMFSARVVDAAADPFVLGGDAARDGGEPGTLLWTPRPDRADCAIVLGPEMPLTEALLVTFVEMVAVGDALATLLPPGIPLVFGWPDRIVINGATAGGIRVAWPDTAPDAVPAWMVAGLRVQVGPDLANSDDDAQMTNLVAEGCADVSARAILESFSRHFLYWINRWLDEGFAPVRSTWLSRAANYGPNEKMELSPPWADRKLLWLEADGDIGYLEDDTEQKAGLRDALLRPSWLSET